MEGTKVVYPVVPVLGIVFVILKLTHVVSWPWIWVTAPFWIPGVILLLGLLIVLAIAGVVATGDR